MPILEIKLTAELDALVNRKVESGLYEDASDVIRAALRALERAECDDELKHEWLKQALQQGIDSGVCDYDPFEKMRIRGEEPLWLKRMHTDPITFDDCVSVVRRFLGNYTDEQLTKKPGGPETSIDFVVALREALRRLDAARSVKWFEQLDRDESAV